MIQFPNGFKITSQEPVDIRLVLSKAEMKTAEIDYSMPEAYFCLCSDDYRIYSFNINNDDDQTENGTGRFRISEKALQEAFDAEVARSIAEDARLNKKIDDEITRAYNKEIYLEALINAIDEGAMHKGTALSPSNETVYGTKTWKSDQNFHGDLILNNTDITGIDGLTAASVTAINTEINNALKVIAQKASEDNQFALKITDEGEILSENYENTTSAPSATDSATFSYVDNIATNKAGKIVSNTSKTVTVSEGSAQGQFKLNNVAIDINNLGTNDKPTFNGIDSTNDVEINTKLKTNTIKDLTGAENLVSVDKTNHIINIGDATNDIHIKNDLVVDETTILKKNVTIGANNGTVTVNAANGAITASDIKVGGDNKIQLYLNNNEAEIYNSGKFTDGTNNFDIAEVRSHLNSVSDTPVENGTNQFTTGGAYTLQQNLQQQINTIEARSDVVDVVACYNYNNVTPKPDSDIVHYDTTSGKISNNDVVKVLIDETHSDAVAYYRWVITSGTGA